MIIEKILNNNVVSSLDEYNREVILVGRGIGWRVQPGQAIDMSKVEKIFRMDSSASTDRLKQLFLEVDVDVIRASNQIIDYARQMLKKRLNKNVYITLTDHISFAAERLKKGITFYNMLNFETRKLYPKEFAIGMHALDIVEEVMGIRFPENEATSIAMHILNAEYDCDMQKIQEVTEIIQKAVNVVRYSFGLNFDEESLDYQRFITHMIFFAQRVAENKLNHRGKDFLYDMLQKEHPREFSCARKIQELVQKDYQIELPEEEVSFLCIHIIRVTAGKQPLG